jgi:pyruvate/2-oxoglutarate dehydrogenase complex dihydrolipoamide dehydrogenase (E3) component
LESFDFVVIGAGAAGEAAAYLARERGATVAVIERDLVGGSCAFWACMPSKTLLHAAGIHRLGGDYPWPRASQRRDWMINREDRDVPDDSGHIRGLQAAGAVLLHGEARLAGPGRVVVHEDGGERTLEARDVIVAVGSRSKVPPLEGLDRLRACTNRDATSARELPRSLVVLGGGPTGLELAQIYARYGVPTTVVHPRRLNDKDHPRNSAAIEAGLRRDGVNVRTGVRAVRVSAAETPGSPHRLELSDGSSVTGHELLLAVGRTLPLEGLGLETVGVGLRDGRLAVDDRLRLADHLYVIGDPAGPEPTTHLGHYQGEMAVRIALGEEVRPDYRAIPHALYTDPETAGVGLQLEQAQERGLEAFEESIDLATTARGYLADAGGHVSIVVDRRERVLLGAFIAGPGATEVIHEAVLAVKTHTPIEVLADTIHAFPTTARVLGTAFVQASRRTELAD